jgi:hypothetical protein
MKSPSQHDFAKIPQALIQRSSFNRQCGIKTTFDVDYLVPIFVDEVLPGDTFNLKLHAFARLATPLKPFMDNLRLTTYFFAVSNRLVWNNWEKFNGAQDNPGDSIDYLIPQIVSPANGWPQGTLQDYLTWPTVGQVVVGNTVSQSALFTRSYNLIYNNWFRDENLQNSVTVDKGDGPDTASNYVLLKRGKAHDYFTSSLPFAQKGPAVPLPLTGNATVKYTNDTVQGKVRVAATRVLPAASGSIGYSNTGDFEQGGGTDMIYDPNGTLYADLSAVTAVTVNAIRNAVSIQHLLEKDARGGTRYTEIIKAHFNVTSPDARLQRPEYLGGGTTPINVNPIAQTSAASGQPTPQGNLAAMGTAAISGHGFVKSFTEHTIIIGLACVTADLTYQQGLNRMFSRRTRYDFYWPDFSSIGEQAVLNKEIYCDGSANDLLTFGYQERYAEYRYKPSIITGKFRSTDPQPLDMWHLAQKFTSLPTLSSTFITSSTPIDRVVAVPSEPDILFDGLYDLICARPMPMYSVPGLLRF